MLTVAVQWEKNWKITKILLIRIWINKLWYIKKTEKAMLLLKEIRLMY